MLLDPLQSRLLFQHALKKGYAVLAVNADSPAAVGDTLEAARLADAPVIIETSLWQLKGRSFGMGDAVTGVARYIAGLAVLAESPAFKNVPVVYHTDHIKGPETLSILEPAIRGIPFQYGGNEMSLTASTISLDASDMSTEENVDMINGLAAIAEDAGVPVTLEMESHVDEGITGKDVTKQLIGAVEENHPGAVHLYAPGLGTRHGLSAEGYPEFSLDAVKWNIELLEEITGRRFGLAMHGSSGLGKNELAAAAQAGVVKVNWSSESLLIRSTAARDFYKENEKKLVKGHPEWKVTAMDNGVQRYVADRYVPVVQARIELLGGKGKALDFLSTL